MRIAGLFSGIGGFELAFSQAGFDNTLLAEIDPAARAVLRAQFPKCEIVTDVGAVGNIPPETTVLTAGFPCQNLSMAGDKTGIDGVKSGVVEKMFDLIARSHVSTVLIENVYFMLQLDRGNGMRRLVERFEALNYDWAYRVIDTMGFGLPQRRRRVYMLASKAIDPREVLFADEAEGSPATIPSLNVPLGFYWTEGRTGIGLTVDGIPPLKVGSSLGIPSAPAVLFPDGEVLMPSLSACERLQGFPPDWMSAIAPNEKRRPQWRLIGNAVSVPVVRWIAERIKSPKSILDFSKEKIMDGAKWPDAAWRIGGERFAIKATDKPVKVERPSILAFRDATWTRLSDRALDGFIQRAVQGGLRTPEGFLDALRGARRKVIHAA